MRDIGPPKFPAADPTRKISRLCLVAAIGHPPMIYALGPQCIDAYFVRKRAAEAANVLNAINAQARTHMMPINVTWQQGAAMKRAADVEWVITG